MVVEVIYFFYVSNIGHFCIEVKSWICLLIFVN